MPSVQGSGVLKPTLKHPNILKFPVVYPSAELVSIADLVRALRSTC